MIVLLLLGFSAGFALCWFARDKLPVAVNGAVFVIKVLEAKAASLKAVP